MADRIIVKAYTPKEIRRMYNISTRQFRKWLEKTTVEHREAIGEPVAGVYSPKQVRAIFNAFDLPESSFCEEA